MSSPGRGRPMDRLDRHCQQYKMCQMCARRIHGKECVGELVRYNMARVNKEYQCQDKAGSCNRLLCECDKQFARGLQIASQSYSKDLHIFYSDFNPVEGNFHFLI